MIFDVCSAGEITAIFVATPSPVMFTDYRPGCVYEVTASLASKFCLIINTNFG